MNLSKIFTGGLFDAIEGIATEWIETNQEKAEAQAVMVKALDPNGKMRRALSIFASRAYGFYLGATVIMIFMSVWEVGGDLCGVVNGIQSCTNRATVAAGMLTELFLPITGSWAAIVGASFGVNATNSIKGK